MFVNNSEAFFNLYNKNVVEFDIFEEALSKYGESNCGTQSSG